MKRDFPTSNYAKTMSPGGIIQLMSKDSIFVVLGNAQAAAATATSAARSPGLLYEPATA
jgi:hypothetical protein